MQNPYAGATTSAPAVPPVTDILKANSAGEWIGNAILILLISGIAAVISGVIAGILPAMLVGLIAWLTSLATFWNATGLTVAVITGLFFLGLVWGASKPAQVTSMMPTAKPAPRPD